MVTSLREPQALRRRFKAHRNERTVTDCLPGPREHLPHKAQAPTPFHILWRHPDNASFTEQGNEYLPHRRNVVNGSIAKKRTPVLSPPSSFAK